MTAARGLVRFISQYKFFFLSFFLLFFSLPVHDGLGRRVHSFHRSMRSQSLSMPDASTTGVYIFAAPPREGGNTKRRQANQRRRGVTMASGRQVGPLLLSSHPVARCFPIVPIEARAHTVHPLRPSRCVPAFIIIAVIIISSERG